MSKNGIGSYAMSTHKSGLTGICTHDWHTHTYQAPGTIKPADWVPHGMKHPYCIICKDWCTLGKIDEKRAGEHSGPNNIH